MTIAVLYTMKNSVYDTIPGIETWGIERDARTYKGPYPVVAHPPCARWGRYWSGGPSTPYRRLKGDDDGCFAAALWAVRTFGGILEHPADSWAYKWFGLATPPRSGGWISADRFGYTCCIEQLRYGHRAQKATWLYAVGCDLPDLKWGRSPIGTGIRMDDGLSKENRQRMIKTGRCQQISKRERARTPMEFALLLIEIARTANIKAPQAREG